jgi:hypothetical protein
MVDLGSRAMALKINLGRRYGVKRRARSKRRRFGRPSAYGLFAGPFAEVMEPGRIAALRPMRRLVSLAENGAGDLSTFCGTLILASP